MVSQTIFEEWFEDLNRRMSKKIGKFCCLLTKQPFTVTKVMSNVTVKFLTPNLTSEVRLLVQGIIRAVKSRYRQQMLQYIVTIAETNNTKSDFKK